MAGNSSARITVTRRVINNRIPQVIASITTNTQNAVDQTAAAVQEFASQIAPVDTGALRNSIYVNNGRDSDYASRISIASGLNPDMQALEELDPEFVIPLSGTNTGNVAVVGVGAHYGIFLEQGTVFQPPQPFMLPAAEASSDDFESLMRNIV